MTTTDQRKTSSRQRRRIEPFEWLVKPEASQDFNARRSLIRSGRPLLGGLLHVRLRTYGTTRDEAALRLTECATGGQRLEKTTGSGTETTQLVSDSCTQSRGGPGHLRR